MQIIENQIFDAERALYGSEGLWLRHCAFDGPADGESALKESRQIVAEDCFCNLRYPFWHTKNVQITGCELTELCRAALWYAEDVRIKQTKLHGIKAVRECRGVQLSGCDIVSPEFGWSVDGLSMTGCTAESEYFMLRSRDLRFSHLTMRGKYAFQYIENAVFEDCVLDTKDAFWHGRNITVRNSIVRGEYLAWYADGLTLDHCTIIGTQPFCYCRGLRLIACKMEQTDLCFERSEVEADILTPVDSIKNPRSGRIMVPAVGEVIMDDPLARGEIVLREA